MTVKEKSIETYLVKKVKEAGGEAIKMNPQGVKGIVDRLIIFPHNISYWVEVKRPKGGRLSPAQLKWRELLTFKYHVNYAVVHTTEQVDGLLKKITSKGGTT